MVKYKAALRSFLKITALVFYHVWHSPWQIKKLLNATNIYILNSYLVTLPVKNRFYVAENYWVMSPALNSESRRKTQKFLKIQGSIPCENLKRKIVNR